MIRIEEDYFAFEFGDRWRVFKLDEHRDYRERIGKLEGTKAVDFLAILDERELYLIEVKDFRGYRIENRDRLLKGELAIEVGQKVRDSLACIVGAFHTSSSSQEWQPYVKLLSGTNVSIKVVLWLEHEWPTHPQQEKKVRASVQTKVFKKKLTWLTSHVFVYSRATKDLPDMQVSELPRN